MAVTNEQINAYLSANPGMSDATIAAAMAQHGVTPAQMAQVTGLGQNVVQSRFDAAQIANTPGMGLQGIGVNTAPAPLSVEDLYRQYAGRGSDPSGLQYWSQQFGDTIDPNEIGIFQSAVAEARAQGTEPAALPSYFQQNPDVAAAYQQNSYGLTPDQFAATHFQNYGSTEGRVSPNGALELASSLDLSTGPNLMNTGQASWVAPELLAIQQFGGDEYGAASFYNPNDGKTYASQSEADAANASIINDSKKSAILGAWEDAQTSKNYNDLSNILANTNTTGYDLYTMFGLTPAQQAEIAAKTGRDLTPDVITDYRGKTYDTATVLNLANQISGIADTSQFSGGVFGVNKGSVGFDYDQAARALGRDLSTGEQVLLDSARSLIDQGITDLSKLGIGDIKSTVTVQSEVGEDGITTGRYFAVVPSGTDSEGNTSYTTRLLSPEEAAKIRTEEITGTGEDAGSYTRRLLDDVVTGRGVVYDGKGKVEGNRLDAGVTYTGKGGTTYQITYDDQGKPRFTTTGFSTSDLGAIAPLLQIASFIPGVAPFAMAANAAIAASQGNVFGALASLAGMGGYTNLATGLNVANAIDKKDVGALAGALLSNPNIAGAASTTMLTDTISFADLGNAANLAINIDNGNWAGVLNSVGSLTGSSDLKVAASAATIVTELGKENPNFSAILNATQTITNATSSASNNVDANVVGGITNRVVDDISTQGGNDLGSSTFIAAVNAGATQEEALAAANTVTETATAGAGNGVVINKIPDAGPSNAVTSTYGQGSVDTNFGDLEGAIATNAINDATRVQKLDEISNQPKFADAYSQARSLLGPNQTFTWNGKEYSTATAAERPDLSAPKVQAATDESAAETARLNRQNTALVTGNAPDQSAAETARFKAMEKTGFFENLYKGLNDQFKLQGEAATEYLKNNPNSPITASVSSAFEAAGELQKNLGGVALALDNKPLADAIISGGSKLQSLGQSIGDGPQDTKNWNDTINLINKASGTEKLAVLAGRVMDGTSGLARQVGLELRQELPALFLGGGLLKPTLIASGLIDTGDTGGAAVVEAYDDVIKRGGTHQEALSAGRKAGGAAAATEAAIQLTLGKLADLGAGKLDNLISKGSAKVAGEGVVEGSQEAGASAAVDLALGNAIDVNKALTQGVLGAAVGKGTAATTSPVDAATTSTTSGAAPAASTTGATDLGTVGSVVPGAGVVQGTDLGAIGSVTPGGDATVGAQNTISVADAQQTAADLGLNVSDDVAVSLATKIDAANNSGNDVSITSDANTVTINDATANTKTTVDASTGTTTVVDSNANTTSQTTVDANANTQTTVVADANANTNTQTTVNNNTNTTTSTTVDTNTNVTTQTTITADTQTTVLTDPNTGTQTTVKVNVNTGEVIDVNEAEIPTDWTPPVINPPKVDTPPLKAAPNEPEEGPSKANLKLPNKGGAGGAGGIGASLPLGIDVDPASLRSRVTEGAIDPLARVKQAQAEFERDVMMNQMDPRFLAAIQQRTNPNQQAQQLDSDVGALAKMLRGDSDAPANEGKYYSYGSEDSIDDILGGKAANYAAGGYVEPLKASGGSMALPLLAKSGGALGKYNGREDFKGGKHVAGDGDGQSDDIPAWLADGEFVFPADVVSALGNGSTKAGTDKLYEMMHSIRDRARSKGPKDLPPPALKSPLDYLKSSKRSK